MDREKELLTCMQKYMESHFTESAMKIIEEVDVHGKEHLRDVLWSFEQCFRKAIELQKKKKKESISYIQISFLHSSFLCGHVTFQIDLMDSLFWGDKEKITTLYHPNFVDELVKEEYCEFEKDLKNKMIRVMYHEQYQYKFLLEKKYLKLFQFIIESFLSHIMKLESYQLMEKSEQLKIIYGEYMCEGYILTE